MRLSSAGHGAPRYRWWGAALVVVAGLLLSTFGARAVAQSAADTSMASFTTSSNGVASTLELAIHDEESLVVNASAFFLDHPEPLSSEFAGWLRTVRAFERYPELDGAALIAVVTAAELPAFAARAVADPTGPPGATAAFTLIPPGDRPFYCFVDVQETRGGGRSTPPGFDYCSDPVIGSNLVSARDSGAGSYLPINTGEGDRLIIQVPMYRGGTVPNTVAARREALSSVFALTLDTTLLLERALQGHDDMGLTLRYQDEHSAAEFSSGTPSTAATTTTIDLQNGWTVETSAAVTSSSIAANGTAIAVLVTGTSLGVLLAALGLILATGRGRALRLVAERTGELRHQALHDALTGLPNRALITDRIEQLLARNRRRGTSGAALFLDLDDFKNINDTLGHEAGDRLLMAVAARMTSTLRNVDTIGRMGGDEFVVLLDDSSVALGPELVAERLLEVMRRPFELDGASMPLVVNTSIGIAVGDRATPGDLLRDADVALYQAKAAGKNRYEVFHAEMQSEVLHRVGLEFELRSALDGDQFGLVYQPIYNLEDLTVVGVEALLRWHHPTQGVVLPDEFIPALEHSGQIREVGRWVLQQSCRQMAEWHGRGDTLDISVNVSGRQLDQEDIVEHIRAALDDSGLEAHALIIEVTETALMRNSDDVARRLRDIKALGVRIAVDDFGTGYSSLAYLQQFPVDSLKIDRMFTNAIATSPESRALIGTLVQLGRDLGLQTLAEGVETTDEMDHLRDESVNQAQGFLLSRPVDAETLERQFLIPTRSRQGAT